MNGAFEYVLWVQGPFVTLALLVLWKLMQVVRIAVR